MRPKIPTSSGRGSNELRSVPMGERPRRPDLHVPEVRREGKMMTAMDAATALETYVNARKMLADMETSPEVRQYKEVVTQVIMLEGLVKDAVKQSNTPRVECLGYEAILTIRHPAPSIVYDLPKIEAEPGGSACIVKTVDEKVLVAIANAKSIDVELFRTVTAAKEIQAVTVREVKLEVQKVV